MLDIVPFFGKHANTVAIQERIRQVSRLIVSLHRRAVKNALKNGRDQQLQRE